MYFLYTVDFKDYQSSICYIIILLTLYWFVNFVYVSGYLESDRQSDAHNSKRLLPDRDE